jgi:hypothetical protein
MKVLSVKQPWASLIVNGIKDVENRVWKTNYRGELLIHATAEPAFEFSQYTIHFKAAQIIEYVNYLGKSTNQFNPDKIINSAIIGKVDLVDCIKDSKSVWAIPDCWNWVLENPVLFDAPILNVRGYQRIWNYKGEGEKT